MSAALAALVSEIEACRLCADRLPHPPRPVVRVSATASILIAGQAPGRRVHESGLPFDDPSGDRLRAWMGLDRDAFYDRSRIAVAAMAFCWPGTVKGADLPPPPICARTWRPRLMAQLRAVKLTLLVGGYAQRWRLGGRMGLTETVRRWRDLPADLLPLPHPSWRNTAWLARNPWFETDVLPELRRRVTQALSTD